MIRRRKVLLSFSVVIPKEIMYNIAIVGERGKEEPDDYFIHHRTGNNLCFPIKF